MFGLLVALRRRDRVGREELLGGELHLAEQSTGILLAASSALLAGNAVVVGRDQQLAVPLQADHGELPQGHIHPLSLAAHGQLTGETRGDAGRDVAGVAAAATAAPVVLTTFHQLHAEDDGIHSLH